MKYFLRLPIRAALENLADGLKTRFSFSIESILTTLAWFGAVVFGEWASEVVMVEIELGAEGE